MATTTLRFWVYLKKRRTPFFGIKMKNTMKMLLKSPRFWVYLQKKKNTILLGLQIKKSNKKMATTLGFWVYLQKRRTPYLYATDEREILEKNLSIIFGHINKK
jgi:hypothetical protein